MPVTAGVGLGFWVVPSSHMLKTEFLCHLCGKGFSGAAIRDIGYQLDNQWDLSHPTFNLSLIVLWLEWMAASLRDPGSIPGGGPKGFHDSFNFVFHSVGECISCAADTHLATNLSC